MIISFKTYSLIQLRRVKFIVCPTKGEGIIPKNKGDEGRKKFFVVVGKDQEGNAIGFVLINSEINKHLPESRRKLHYLLKASEYEFLGDQDRFVDCSDFKKNFKGTICRIVFNR